MYKCTNGQHALNEFRLVKEKRSAGVRRKGAEHSEEGEGEQKKNVMGKGEKGIEAGGTSNREFTKAISYL